MHDPGFLGPYAAVAQLGATAVIACLFIWQVTHQFPKMVRDQRADANAAVDRYAALNERNAEILERVVGDFRSELAAEREWRERSLVRTFDRLDSLECQKSQGTTKSS